MLLIFADVNADAEVDAVGADLRLLTRKLMRVGWRGSPVVEVKGMLTLAQKGDTGVGAKVWLLALSGCRRWRRSMTVDAKLILDLTWKCGCWRMA